MHIYTHTHADRNIQVHADKPHAKRSTHTERDMPAYHKQSLHSQREIDRQKEKQRYTLKKIHKQIAPTETQRDAHIDPHKEAHDEKKRHMSTVHTQ
jgi:hypothetical protein